MRYPGDRDFPPINQTRPNCRASEIWEKLGTYREELTSDSYQALEAAVVYIVESVSCFLPPEAVAAAYLR